jgi:hypothetical protein
VIRYADVSNHDRNRRKRPLNWATAFKKLAPIAAVKLTEGDWFVDPYGVESCKAAHAAGAVVVMGYHCVAAGNIKGQVDMFRRQLDATAANAAMADVEPFKEMVENGRWPRWTDVVNFGRRFAAVDDRVLTWYVPHWFWDTRPGQSLGRPDLGVLAGPLVSSNYVAAPTSNGPGWVSYGGRRPDIWQYTSTASVNGLSGRTDVNAYRGSLDELVALLTGDDMTPAQEKQLYAVNERLRALVRGQATVATKWAKDPTAKENLPLVVTVNQLVKDVAALKAASAQDHFVEVSAKLDALAAAVAALAGAPTPGDTLDSATTMPT